MAAGSGRELRARRGLAAPGRAAVPAQRGPQLLPSAPSRVPNTGDPRGSVNQRCDGREVHKRICRQIGGGTVAGVANDSGGDRKTSGPWYASEPSTAPFPAVASGPPGPSRPSRRARRGKRRKLVIAVTAGALAVVAGIAAVIVTVVLPGGNTNTTGFVPSGSSAAQDAEQITTAFLQAWQTGDLGQASRYTDHPSAAQAALAAYSKYLHLRKLTATTLSDTIAPSGTSSTPRESVGYAINATVAAPDGAKVLSGTWKYQASLVTYSSNGTHSCGISPGAPMSSRRTAPRPPTWPRSRWLPRLSRSTTPAGTISPRTRMPG